jgi:hypothetical protein
VRIVEQPFSTRERVAVLDPDLTFTVPQTGR